MRLLPITKNYNLIIPYLTCLVYEKNVNKKPQFTLFGTAINRGFDEFRKKLFVGFNRLRLENLEQNGADD